jgi:nucleotide-binding universal stress UspA family protein
MATSDDDKRGRMTLAPATGDIHLKSILIATDFSEASDKALRHALAIARHYGAKLYLVHVVSSLGFTLVGADAIHLATEIVSRDARQLENRLIQSGALTGFRHEVIVRQGSIWDQLDQIIDQEQIELVIVGTHARQGLGKLLLGSVAEHMFRHASCLVLTVGPGSLEDSPVGSTRAIRPFLFATDFSEPSLHALPYAISSANHFGTKLVLLHVISDTTMPNDLLLPSAGNVMEFKEKARLSGLGRLEQLLSRQPKLGLPPEFIVEFGSPAERILEVADTLKSDAVILGLHHKASIGAASHMPWATAYQVVCGACCSVLTVRD